MATLDELADKLFYDWRYHSGEDAVNDPDAENALGNYLRTYSVDDFRHDFTGLGGKVGNDKSARASLEKVKAQVCQLLDDAT